jgi:formyl-CoA transferase
VEHDVPVATAFTAADMFTDAQFAARGDLMSIDDPVIGPVRQQAPYPRFVGQPVPVPTGAPVLGADTDAVLGELGLDPEAITALRADGVV